MNWTQLQKRFHDIVIGAGGPEKSSSGNIYIEFDFDGRISVTLGAYDIGNWNRHTEVGVFDTEEAALQATSKKLDDAEAEVVRHNSVGDGICSDCEVQINEEGDCRCTAGDRGLP